MGWSVHGALSCAALTKLVLMDFMECRSWAVDWQRGLRVATVPACPLSPSYAPLTKHIQTVSLYCQDAGDGLSSHFNHWAIRLTSRSRSHEVKWDDDDAQAFNLTSSKKKKERNPTYSMTILMIYIYIYIYTKRSKMNSVWKWCP